MIHRSGNQSLLPIILIDDDAEDLELNVEEMVRMKIENEIFSFQLPCESLDFLRLLRHPPYFISCDVHMAKMDAYELRSIILAELPQFSKVPFYILTSFVTAMEIELAQPLQINGFYTKGYT